MNKQLIEQIEAAVSQRIDEQIKEFDLSSIDKLKESILFAQNKTYHFEYFLKDMLQRAERLECFNVCIVVRDLLKEFEK